MTNMIDVVLDEGISSLASKKNIDKAIYTSCLSAKNIKNPSLCLRFASNAVVQALNNTWRNQDKVTDVLSFPMLEADAFDDGAHLGDVVLAVPFVTQEAQRLNLSPEHHTLHLIVHSTLHLLGYDHIQDDEAHIMQGLENQIMQTLNLHQPYPDCKREYPA